MLERRFLPALALNAPRWRSVYAVVFPNAILGAEFVGAHIKTGS
jgi:hypothetical protein